MHYARANACAHVCAQTNTYTVYAQTKTDRHTHARTHARMHAHTHTHSLSLTHTHPCVSRIEKGEDSAEEELMTDEQVEALFGASPFLKAKP